MEREIYNRFMTAKRNGNIIEMKKIYDINPNDLLIKFEYAKLLRKVDVNAAKKLLKELIGSPNENFALLELGSIERSLGNYNMSYSYFQRIINGSKSSDKDRYFATMELGKLEVIMGNKDKAKELFNSLVGTFNEYYALLELGKLELSEGNTSKAKELFKKGIGSKCGSYCLLWLGRAEAIDGNNMSALLYFNELLVTPVREHAKREIERIKRIQLEESKVINKKVRRKENEG